MLIVFEIVGVLNDGLEEGHSCQMVIILQDVTAEELGNECEVRVVFSAALAPLSRDALVNLVDD